MVRLRRSDSRSTMSISCVCSSFSASSWRRIWIDPDIDASGFRISWAMPAAISPTAARRCCSRASRSSRRMVVTSWKVTSSPARPPDVSQGRRAQAEIDLAAVGAPVAVVGPAALPVGQLARQRRGERRRQAEHVRDVVPGDALGRCPVMSWAARLNVRMRPGRVRGHEPRRQAVDDVLAVRLQVGDLVRRVRHALVGRAHALGERPAQQRDGEESGEIRRDGVLRHDVGRQDGRLARHPDEPRRRRRRVPGPARARRRAACSGW